MSSSGHAKRDREKAKRERAELKRERREVRRSDAGDAAPAAPERPQAEVLAALAALHDALEGGRITFEAFEADKSELMAQLDV